MKLSLKNKISRKFQFIKIKKNSFEQSILNFPVMLEQIVAVQNQTA